MALTVCGLTKTYPNGVCALKNLSLSVGNHKFGLLGPNGAQEATRAGIDPYNKLIGRISDDNMIDITE